MLKKLFRITIPLFQLGYETKYVQNLPENEEQIANLSFVL